jgi:hypothetical protein
VRSDENGGPTEGGGGVEVPQWWGEGVWVVGFAY